MSTPDKLYGYLPFGETGAGTYGKLLLEECRSHIDLARPKMLGMVEAERFVVDQTMFSVGDYGCADGSTSMNLITAFIETVRRKRGDRFPVTVIYEDKVGNDFNSVFNRLHGILKHPKSYLSDYKNVYTFATATSFYEQCAPDDSLDVILSFLASQWLPNQSTVYRESISRFPHASEEERDMVAVEGAKAWERFLLHRAKELKKGGLLFVSTPCEDPDHGPEQTYLKQEDYIRTMIKIWKQYRNDDMITEQEFTGTNFNYCDRTKAELIAPFSTEDSPVVKAGMKLLGVDIYHVESIFKKRWRETLDSADDRMRHAYDFVSAHRAWSNSTFMTALSSSRSAEEKNNILDRFYDDIIRDMGHKSPANLKTDGIIGYVFIQKGF